MKANKTILQMKYARVVKLFAGLSGLSLEDSLEVFYDSYLYKMMSEGIADMHCRSDQYLVDLLMDEQRISYDRVFLTLKKNSSRCISAMAGVFFV